MNSLDQHTLRWHGDDIGLGDGPALVSATRGNSLMFMAFREALLVLDCFDDYGRGRIVAAADVCAEHDHLHPDDLQAWRDWEGKE